MPVSKRFFIALLLVFTGNFFFLNAQNLSSSPYSRFGIGDLQFSGFSKNLGMGGISYGLNDLNTLNPGNPAGNSGIVFTTYEAGIKGNFTRLSTTLQEQQENTVAFNYFAFAFPLKLRKWSTGFGLMPYSNTGYSIKQDTLNDLGGHETRTYQGSGGLNQFFITTAAKAGKFLNLGATASYLFGVIHQDRRILFSDQNYFNTFLGNETSVGWFYFDLGAQLHFDSLKIAPSDSLKMLVKREKQYRDSLAILKREAARSVSSGNTDSVLTVHDPVSNTGRLDSLKAALEEISALKKSVILRRQKSEWNLTWGFRFSPSANLHANRSVLAYNYWELTSGVQTYKDTTVNTEGEKGRVELPFNFGAGFAFKKGTKWLFGSDLTFQKWSGYSAFGAHGGLADSWRVSAGAQLLPNDRAFKSYPKYIQYRLGFYYGQTFLTLNQKQLGEMGVTAGLGLPFPRVGTMLQLSIEGGERGTLSHDLIREKYIKFSLGLTINDRWFIRPKYD